MTHLSCFLLAISASVYVRNCDVTKYFTVFACKSCWVSAFWPFSIRARAVIARFLCTFNAINLCIISFSFAHILVIYSMCSSVTLLSVLNLTISVLQGYCAVITEYGIPSEFVRKSTASLQIKISAAQLNFSNRNVIYILEVE